MFNIRIYLLLFSIIMVSCKENSHYKKNINDRKLLIETVKKLNEVILDNNFPPPIASRNYAYATIAAYETFALGDGKNYQSLCGQLNGLTPMLKIDKTKSYDFEFAAILALCKVGNEVTFPSGSLDEYQNSLLKMADSLGMPSDIKDNSLALADTVSKTIIQWSKKDRYLESRSMPAYAISKDDGTWNPTPAAYASALEPHWGILRTMVLDSSKQFLPPAPYPFNIKDKDSPYFKQVEKTLQISKSLTKEQQHIALFWDDNPFKLNVVGHAMFSTKKYSPPGHWMNICGIAANKSKANFGTSLCGYTKTSIALFDAFIACWEAKYTYNTARPETIINKFIDNDWRPFIQTPPFPEYTAGHSTISAAAAEALTSVYGENFAYIDDSEEEFGIKKRSFTSFRQAAEENIKARFYGLIHYEYSCINGNRSGKQIGNFVVSKLKMNRK